MNNIELLDKNTIDKIAAGEVVDRPSSIVKELVENAIDAKSSAITIEVKEGGISFIRITDNGCGIPKKEISKAFLRHSTSKIRKIEDLSTISSLGFRGEALSSIAAVSQVELITKTYDELTGTRYLIDGGEEKSIEDIGAPQGTTFIIRNIFYNTPARKKFLKSTITEGSYITSLVERLALSNPNISFKYIINNQTKLYTTGNSNLKDIIYNVYGRDITSNLIEIEDETNYVKIKGYIGNPNVCRGNRNYENYFINGRYIKNTIIAKAIEDAFKPFLMQHKYPFTSILINLDGNLLDVNVHPAKMEVRFSSQNDVYDSIYTILHKALTKKESIPEISLDKPSQIKPVVNTEINKIKNKIPEPFEFERRNEFVKEEKKIYTNNPEISYKLPEKTEPVYEQQKLFDMNTVADIKIIGQVFDTYWIIQYTDKMFIIDQHAAHEKVLYERIVNNLKSKNFTSQIVNPPIIVSLTSAEEEIIQKFKQEFEMFGFDIENFGGKEYSIHAVPDNLYNLSAKELFIEMIDSLSGINNSINETDMILDKIATMSCKAAVKGNNKLSYQEMEALFKELITLDNPYNCPHGRPTIVSMSKYELEKKFKRVL